MQVAFDYNSYIDAMKSLSGMKEEIESHRERLASEQLKDQMRIAESQQDIITRLEQIKEHAVKEFRDVSLRYREVCNMPAETAVSITNSASVDETVNCQTKAIADLQKAIDFIINSQEEERIRIIRRQEEERKRRQEQLDKELYAAGVKPSG